MRNHSLFFGSSYDRGLDILLGMWPEIKKIYPEATLDVCYGWDLFDKGYANNPERMNWKNKIDALMKQPGITHHGRVGKEELKLIRQKCGVWTYPTYFAEINCITALECQQDGLVPVTMDDFALKESVGSGFKIKGDIYDTEVKKEYLDTLMKLIGDRKLWEKESKKAQEFAKDFQWDKIAKEWSNNFE
jgi:glycosyltransferase involved in cell wall biosynthesis